MITYIKGTLISKLPESIRGACFVIEVNGLAYEVLTHSTVVNATAQAEGDTIQLHTALIVRENALSVVGFLNREERDLFNLLQNASGVGVKVALALLEALSVGQLIEAIIENDYKTLTVAKGVGPKLAQKIAIELKDKITGWRSNIAAQPGLTKTTSAAHQNQTAFFEAESVLLALGYELPEIAKSFKQQVDNTSAEELGKLSSETILKNTLRDLATTV
ncbi:MAG: Holliday junction branch migration protein RuvA [Cyanobacteria bacterium P01_H01_bin.74]